MLGAFSCNAISRAMTRLLRYTLLGLLITISLIALLIYSLTWRPEARETLPVSCNAQAPTLVPGQALKVMTWNVQYLAGKRYVFWNDLAAGNDENPTPADMAFSLDEVTRVIRDEQPDILLLQELDDGAKASDYQNQFKLLQERLADLYPCSARAYDWKADFVPQPHIFGSVGRQLATLSRFEIEHAERVQLPVAPANLISRQFEPKNALLVTYLPLSAHNGPMTHRMHTRMRRKWPRVRRRLSFMAASGARPRSTSRYSPNARVTISQMPGRKYSDRPSRINKVLSAVSRAKRGHR